MTVWVLLRGLARESRHWGEFPELLRSRTADAVATLDLPGNGRLSGERSPGSVEAMVDAYRTLLRQQGSKPPYRLLAMSLGAMVAIRWAAKYPEECLGLVLINTSSRAFSPFYERLRPRGSLGLLRALASAGAPARERAILELTTRHPRAGLETVLSRWTTWRIEHPVSVANSIRQLWAASRFRAPAERPATPVLLLVSLADGLVDPQCSWRIARGWGVELRAHPSAGHDLALDDPEWLAGHAAEWLAGSQAPSQR